jgi:hypothetical protein
MRIVRPNVNRPGRRPVARLGALLGVAVFAVAACARAERSAARASADTSVITAAARPEPSRYLADIPPWPADTGAAATDREGRLPGRLASAVPSCGAATPIVTPDSVGPLYPGQPLANLFGACPHLSRLWHYDNGKYVPAIAVKLGGALLLLDASGVMSDAVVTRVTALEGARTAEGIGPGASLADVARVYGAPTWRRDQCAVSAAFASRPGLVIHVAIPESGRDAYTCEDIRRFATGNDFAHFPQGSTVAWIAAELDAGP